jgi:DNA-binding transcriptional regulator YhcF (GntR family)
MLFADILTIEVCSWPLTNGYAKSILIALSRYVNDEGTCFPSQLRLSKDTGFSRNTVIKSLRFLEDEGIISSDLSHRGGHTTYSFICLTEDTMKRESCTSQVHEGNVIKLDDINSKSKSTITLLPASQYEQLFEKFYDVYPRKRGKGAARLSFARAARRTPPNFILSKAHEFRAHCIEQATEIQFIPYPSVWLNQERWDDDLAAEAETKSAWGELANDL